MMSRLFLLSVVPGVGWPRVGRPGVGWPRVGRPGVGWPRVGWPEVSWPRVGRPGVGWPRVGRPGVGWPRVGRPGVSWPLFELGTVACCVARGVADSRAGAGSVASVSQWAVSRHVVGAAAGVACYRLLCGIG